MQLIKSFYEYLSNVNSRVGLKIPIVDGFYQLLRHFYYLLFTRWKQRGEEGQATQRGYNCQKSSADRSCTSHTTPRRTAWHLKLTLMSSLPLVEVTWHLKTHHTLWKQLKTEITESLTPSRHCLKFFFIIYAKLCKGWKIVNKKFKN